MAYVMRMQQPKKIDFNISGYGEVEGMEDIISEVLVEKKVKMIFHVSEFKVLAENSLNFEYKEGWKMSGVLVSADNMLQTWNFIGSLLFSIGKEICERKKLKNVLCEIDGISHLIFDDTSAPKPKMQAPTTNGPDIVQ